MSTKAGAIIGFIIGLIPLVWVFVVGGILDMEVNTLSMIITLPAILLDFITFGLGYFVWPVLAAIIGAIIGHKMSRY